jgi:nucleotide-binding universal stress UspA family protein
MTMKILVGYGETPESEDALCLAKGLAAITGAVLVLADIKADSPAHALQEMAAVDSADLIVVGSSHRGDLGAALVGTVGVRLLHRSPCPVAIAPRGLAQAGRWWPAMIGVAFDGSPEAGDALRQGRQIAHAAKATLQVIAVAELIGSMHEVVDPETFKRASEKQAQQWLREARDRLRGDLTIGTRLAFGDPGSELWKLSDRLDLLVVGARGHGRVRRALFGSVSSHLIEHCRCPLIVTPRGSHVEVDPSTAENYAAMHGSPRKNRSFGRA